MRAGKLDKTISIERAGTVVDDYGTPTEGWATIATVRAQIIQQTTQEFLAAPGTNAETATVFRIRHRDGLQVADRITYAGRAFDLKEVKELGRREGLDLRCVASE
ncbi:phage head closure protein [Rhizobium sp. PL01]|uniref:phage head closure protein n=1 Tax=Rhizobium sp. PL01 TaxID=3085631 RepID=UPI0029829274|nr:phage head closure protein [Rhizobium sp. PL01]MDW5313775.1 phage head closure protein [Rhizobium sp. PL01]